MHEPSTFSYQLAEYKAMPKLTKLMHRTLFWIEMVQHNRSKMNERYQMAGRSVTSYYIVENLKVADQYRIKLSFCTARLKAAQSDLKNCLIEIEELNKIIA